jgi:hypothetical protein
MDSSRTQTNSRLFPHILRALVGAVTRGADGDWGRPMVDARAG